MIENRNRRSEVELETELALSLSALKSDGGFAMFATVGSLILCQHDAGEDEIELFKELINIIMRYHRVSPWLRESIDNAIAAVKAGRSYGLDGVIPDSSSDADRQSYAYLVNLINAYPTMNPILCSLVDCGVAAVRIANDRGALAVAKIFRSLAWPDDE